MFDNGSDSEDGHFHSSQTGMLYRMLLQALLIIASAVACGYLQAFVSKTQDFAKVCFLELQNPVVLVNLLLHSSVVCYLCNGYANHNARFLKGKPNYTVLATTAGALGLLTIAGRCNLQMI
ncbi:BTE_collapsed_G0004220.mRNA.1.CDS.1 [Saccharomyces cerevisiae]|nr:BTE_collapsed_G0004220.mRNA.1.CDS.1 [Saccharomyces cerevisiae]